jgi:4-hydroxythreonine-4-phosphate dehydrogenase
MQKLLDGMREDGWNITGPMSADSSLTPAMRPKFDVVVSCYHDQLLPAFKALYFGKSAQCTLGLPIVRVSVDHGTAEDLYLKGKADCGSLRTAVRWAKRNLDTRRAGQ